MLRLLQEWISLYQKSYDYSREGVEVKNSSTYDARADILGDTSTTNTVDLSDDPGILSSITPPPYLSVMCEMIELFLKIYLRSTSDKDATPVSSSSSSFSSLRGVKRSRSDSTADVDPSCIGESTSSINTCSQAEDETIMPAEGMPNKKRKSTEKNFASVPFLKHSNREFNDDGNTANVDKKGRIMYHFRCSAPSIRSFLFPFAKSILDMDCCSPLTTQSPSGKMLSLAALGKREQVLWIADILSNIGFLLMRKRICMILPSTCSAGEVTTSGHLPFPCPRHNNEESNSELNDDDNDDVERYSAGAEGLELSQQIYALAAMWPPHSPDDSLSNDMKESTEIFEGTLLNECKALLSAIAVRIDINCIQTSKSIPSTTSCCFSENSNSTSGVDFSFAKSDLPPEKRSAPNISRNNVSSNVLLLKRNLHTVETMMESLFKQGLTQDHPFHKLFVMLSLTARLMLGEEWEVPQRGNITPTHCDVSPASSAHEGMDNNEPTAAESVSAAEIFLCKHMSSMLALSPFDLLKCADLALCEEASGRSNVVARKLLRLSVQLLMRSSSPSYPVLGNIYKKLVDLSPDKKDVSNDV